MERKIRSVYRIVLWHAVAYFGAGCDALCEAVAGASSPRLRGALARAGREQRLRQAGATKSQMMCKIMAPLSGSPWRDPPYLHRVTEGRNVDAQPGA